MRAQWEEVGEADADFHSKNGGDIHSKEDEQNTMEPDVRDKLVPSSLVHSSRLAGGDEDDIHCSASSRRSPDLFRRHLREKEEDRTTSREDDTEEARNRCTP